MYRLLIVDDEVNIVDSLYEFFQEVKNIKKLNLDIYKAYSGVDAFDLISRTKIDIVISDIQMPGITGFDLLENIRRYWPRCRLIFLTGYEDFNYIYKAIHNDRVDYMLKTEGDEELLKTVEKVIVEIDKELRDERLVITAKQQMYMAIPLFKKEYFMELLHGVKTSASDISRKFGELEIPLKADTDVLLMIGRVDNQPGDIATPMKAQTMYELQNILKQFLYPAVTLESIIIDYNKLLFFIQPGKLQNPISFIKGTLESAQTACMELLKLSLSFVLCTEACAWENIGHYYEKLKLMQSKSYGFSQEILLSSMDMPDYKSQNSEDTYDLSIEVYSGIEKVKLLETYFEVGEKEKFLKVLLTIMDINVSNKLTNNNLVIELYSSIALFFISLLNRMKIYDYIGESIDLALLGRLDAHKSWNEVIDYFFKLTDLIFHNKKSEQEKRMHEAINTIHRHIVNNLKGDISLVVLAELVYLNPSYLSRVYKKVTGKNLFDYINEVRLNSAKKLLKNANMKIHEIALEIGYNNASYFTRFFKNATGITPQEYRDKQ